MEYSNMKILREVARSQGLKGWTALRKNNLREFLISSGVRPSTLRKPKQVPSTSNTDTLLERFRKIYRQRDKRGQRALRMLLDYRSEFRG